MGAYETLGGVRSQVQSEVVIVAIRLSVPCVATYAADSHPRIFACVKKAVCPIGTTGV